MKIIVIGATGTIGSAVADALAAHHEVVCASRTGQLQVDVEDLASVERMFATVGDIDSVVSCATGTPARWRALFGPIDNLGDAQLTSLFDGVRAQIKFILAARKRVKRSIVITTGALAQIAVPGSAAVTMMAAGIEGFVKGAALDMPAGTRINAVSPPWVKETMEKMGMDSSTGMPAKVLAESYVAAVEGTMNGQILQPWST